MSRISFTECPKSSSNKIIHTSVLPIENSGGIYWIFMLFSLKNIVEFLNSIALSLVLINFRVLICLRLLIFIGILYFWPMMSMHALITAWVLNSGTVFTKLYFLHHLQMALKAKFNACNKSRSLPKLDRLLALLTNTRLCRKSLPVSNAVAYLACW